MYELLDRVVRVEDVRGCIVFDMAGQPVVDRTSGASAETRTSLRLLVQQLIHERSDETRRELMSYKIVARRMGRFICGVIAGPAVDELTLRMQLNILAIKMNATAAQPPRPQVPQGAALPMNAVRALERELISDVGPLGQVLFEAALKRLHVTAITLSAQTAREVASYLAGEIPERARRSWLSRSTAIIEAAAAGLPRPLPPLVRPDASPSSGPRSHSSTQELSSAVSRRRIA